jgi:NTE family protein
VTSIAEKHPAPITGLVLTGGGARAAYQVGALRAIAELRPGSTPFQVVAGTSAGAINSAAVAIHADDFQLGMSHLISTWRSLSPDQVYRTDIRSVASIGASWIRQLSAGGWLGPANVNALLDTTPLRGLLRRTLAMARIRDHVLAGRLIGAAVTATGYHSGTALTFYDGAPELAPWSRSARIGVRARLGVEHVLASSAIPIFFPPVTLSQGAFGDGCIRLSAPLSPAIHLGAQRILAIGVRYPRTPAEANAQAEPAAHAPTSIAQIVGVLLNAIFLDSLEADIERLERINATLALLSAEQRGRMTHPLRRIPLLVLRPSRDLGSLAVEEYHSLPITVRHLLKGIGATGESGWDLVSYLAFEQTYIERLLELGYRDTCARHADLAAFFASSSESC